ncbi:hypothetical protein GPA19_08115 [Azoarcus indigens]|uniref:Uncharacterized protein n=1 Tax=Azoarcus indigens TaxID=29545 RepID=A0A4R6DYL8_9RHOO|nr:hypothetical protein [Azoarcus indigens]NMG64909.1 hypothetical protein [Azoarcus indigens]TDN50446.1 hypothetical protein C7389_109140 [Azoarcus indigens]
MSVGKYSGYRVFMPYCLRRISDGRYIVLNRDYKPLGIPSCDNVDLASHPTVHAIKITPAVARKLSWEGKDDLDCIYLHGGGSTPKGEALKAYSERLAVLMAIHIEVERPYRLPAIGELG